MTDEIIKIRERLVELSSDPIETRNLLDKLTEKEIENANIHSPFHVGEKDIVETKDLEIAEIYKTKTGYVIHYHGGYSILVDDKMMSTATAIQSVIDGVPAGVTDKDDRDAIELANSAIEMAFRMPMFIFSNPPALFSIATIATEYMLLLQKMGEVPTEETENEEYDKFLVQIAEIVENAAKGLEKEGKEYERRMAIDYGKGSQTSEGQSQGESKAEA